MPGVQEVAGTPAQWAQFGAMGMVCLMLFSFLGAGARWLLGYVTRRDERYAEETRRRDELFAAALKDAMDKSQQSIGIVMQSHEKTAAQIVGSLDRLSLEVRGNGNSKV